MSKRKKLTAVLLFLIIAFPIISGFSQTVSRFPKPDFQSGYQRPDLQTPLPRAQFREYIDIALLILVLAMASYITLKLRSRQKLFILMLFSVVYFGFYREGCVCSIGAIQNVTFALFNSGYLIPISVTAFFIIPLFFTLFLGRSFCAGACPLGALQDLMIIRPVRVPGPLENLLGIIPYIYLGLAVLFAATGAGFIICQYDPFIGIFRFAADFNMIFLGILMLLLGTVIARPYCRYFCPYGVLLNWMSRLSKWHVTITPDLCNNCRLCEEACPFGAIKPPAETEALRADEKEVKPFALLLILLPVIVLLSGWAVSTLHPALARQHFIVSLAEEIRLEDSGSRMEQSDKTKAFRATGQPTRALYSEAKKIQQQFKTGSWILGGFLGLIIGLRILGLFIRRRDIYYTLDKGKCLSCARCFSYCPYEQVRLGIITPEQAEAVKPLPRNI